MGGLRTHDEHTSTMAHSAPGADTRQWTSIGIVDADTPQQRSVTFTTEYGPLVNVTLQPSGVPVVCRVAHEVAGNGEGEWFPFLAGDEVVVIIPEGAEDAGCVIVGRLNQEIDAWPSTVAGQDATTNTFGFRRLRTPYVIETAASYVIRDATTGAFISIKDGALTLGNSDNAFMALSASIIGFQNGTADVLMHIDVEASQVVVEAKGTKFVVDGMTSSFYTTGTLALGTSGNVAAEHATSIEAMANLVAGLLSVLGVAAAGGPVALAAFLAAFTTPAAAQAQAAAILPLIAALPLSPAITAAIAAAMATPKVPGTIVGVGAPGLLIG